jgi:hypothetical protein
MRMVRLLVTFVLASSGAAATVIPLGEFRSLELRNGGHVIVRPGAVQRVSIIKGDLRHSRVRVADGQRLVIDRSGRECPEGYRLQIEVVTPHLPAVAVSNGGIVQTVGDFPAQASIVAGVKQGGMIDIRSMAADRVDASVYSGGRIFTTSRKSLRATVESGGGITYWGEVHDVEELVHDGGAVSRGAAGDAEKPLSELGPNIPPVPPLPRPPSVRPIRERRYVRMRIHPVPFAPVVPQPTSTRD